MCSFWGVEQGATTRSGRSIPRSCNAVNLENIEEVDFVWLGELLHELVGCQQSYDWIIASHVIEHSPDLIIFLVECESLLKPDGVLAVTFKRMKS